jgi:uridine phosphorylase
MGTNNVEILMLELDALFNIDLKKREPKPRKKRLKFYRIGTSGSIQEDIRIGSHLVTDYAIGLDPLIHFYEHHSAGDEWEIEKHLQEYLQLSYAPYCFRGSESLISKFKDIAQVGNTVTCPGFYAPQGRELRVPIRYKNIVELLQYFKWNEVWLTNLEMETAGYYAFGKMLNHDIVSLNAIVANRIRDSFSKDPNKIIDSLIKKVIERI